MKRVVVSSISSRIRRRLARREEPVSVMSTMASATPGMPALTSVVPQENSTSASMPRPARKRRVTPTSSVATRLPRRSSRERMAESSGTAMTQRRGREETLP